MKLPLLFLNCLLLCACTIEDDKSAIPTPIRVGVLPDQSPAVLEERYAGLMTYLEADTGLELEFVIPASYEEMLRQFEGGELHLALFGGLTFVQAERASGAAPLATRDVDLKFTSCYLADGATVGKSIEDFAGQDFAFGPRLSTSGHLMPRHFMTKSGTIPEQTFSSIRFSSGHDETVQWVAQGAVAIGVVNCVILQSMLDGGRLQPGDVSIVANTPAYTNYVWAVKPDLNDDARGRLLEAFLALDATIPQHATILEAIGAAGFLPAAPKDFDDVRAAAQSVGLLYIRPQ